MSATKRPEDRSKRRGSDNRQRQDCVTVRLNSFERGALMLEAARLGKAPATLLRDAFLATLPVGEETQR